MYLIAMIVLTVVLGVLTVIINQPLFYVAWTLNVITTTLFVVKHFKLKKLKG